MRVVMLAPGEDPTRNRTRSKGPTLSGCLFKAGVIGAVIVGALWLFFQSQQPVAVAELPTETSTASSTITPTYNRTWTPEPENTRRPTASGTPAPTLTGTQTLTPEWYQCTGQLMPMWCYTISNFPQYEPTYAMAMYQTQVAPLTPTATRTRIPARTSTPRPAVRRSSGGGSGGSLRAQPPAQAAPNRVAPTTYATYWLPPVAATEGPTSIPPLPNYCVPGSTWANWGTPNVTPYVITLTPRPECLGTPMLETTPTPTGTLMSSGIIIPDELK